MGPTEQTSSAWTREPDALAAPSGHILAHSLISVLARSLLCFCFPPTGPISPGLLTLVFLQGLFIVYSPCSNLLTLLTKHLDPATPRLCGEFQLSVQGSAHIDHFQLNLPLLHPPFSISARSIPYSHHSLCIPLRALIKRRSSYISVSLCHRTEHPEQTSFIIVPTA